MNEERMKELDIMSKILTVYNGTFSGVAKECLKDIEDYIISQQQEIERLKGDNKKLTNCIHSIYHHDLKQIDNLCDLANVHRFTLLRKELEELLKLPEPPKGVEG